MNKLVAFGVAAFAAVSAFAAELPEPVGGVITIDIDTDVEYTTVLGSGVAKIVKEGTGQATLAANNTAFTGEIEIREGTLAGCVKHTTAGTGYDYVRSFGSPTRITILEGATLYALDKGSGEVTAAAPETYFLTGQLVVGGQGVGDLGAVRFCPENGDISIHYVWQDVTLTSATTLDASHRWGFGGGTFDMGGYDLTLIGGNIFELGRSMSNICLNPGDIYVRDKTSLLWESMGTFVMPNGYVIGDKTCYLSGGGCIRSFTTTYGNAKFPWGVRVTGAGEIMGFMNNANLDWETNHSWPMDYYGYFHTPIVLADAQTEFRADFYQDSKGDTVNFGAGVAGPGRMIVGGDSQWRRGQVVLRGPSTSTLGALKVYAASLIVMNGATLSVTNAPENNQWNEPTGVDSAASPVLIGGVRSDLCTPRLLIEGGGVFKTRFTAGVNDDSTASTNDTVTLIGHTSGTYGIMDIREGAVVTNVLYAGVSGQGAVYMRGGDVFLKTKRLGNVGVGGYGAFVMDGGRLTTNCKIEIGTQGRGIFIQRGGYVDFATDGNLSNSFSSQFSLARAGSSSYGCYYNCGGTLYAPKSQVWLMKHNSLVNGYGAEAFFTLDGANAKAQVRQVKSMVQTSSVKYGAVTLRNGGELACDRMFRDNFIQECGASTVDTWANIRHSDFTSRFHLVFDGGVLKTTKAGEFFSYEKLDGSAAEAADETRLPERVLVYEKGAVIDTAGNDVVFRAPLAAPQGKCLDAVTLPEDLTKENVFVGPRRILVTDSANGLLVAGAVADFNVTNRQQRGIIVTHPGENLPEGVKVRVENSANNGWTDLTVANGGLTLRTPVSGGLVKRGAGKLSLVGANTYGGKTRIEGGAIEFLNEEGMTGNDVEFAAEAVEAAELGAPLLMANRLKLDAGKKLRVIGVDGLTVASFGKMRTLVSVANAMSAMPDVELVDSEGQVVTSADWRFSFSADRKTLKFGKARGLVVLVQ